MKLKLTDLNTGQESLLLVTKINMKGLLVQSANTLAVGTPVHLSLSLDESGSTLYLRGEVYRIAQRSSGQKGMIIQFVDPSENDLNLIKAYIEGVKIQSDGESQEYDPTPSGHRTVVVQEDVLSKLSFSPTEKSSKESLGSVATFDEEEARAKYPNFAEETRLVHQAEVESLVRKNKPRRWPRRTLLLLAFLFLATFVWSTGLVNRLVSGLATWIQSSTESRKPSKQERIAAPQPEEPTDTEEASSSKSSQAQIKTPRRTSADLRKVSIEETPGFVKVTLEGTEFRNPELTKLNNPQRLSIDLKTTRTFSVDPSLAVGKNPLLRVRTLKPSGFVQVILDLYPVEFPRYDVKSSSEEINIYLYKP